MMSVEEAGDMQGVSVFRDDGMRGRVVAGQDTGDLIVEFIDGSRLVVAAENLALQRDGSYRVSQIPPARGSGSESKEEIVIPVIAEELTVEAAQVARRKVRVHKRVETRAELVDVPTVHEAVLVEHIPVNEFVEDSAPEMREENGVLVIPVIEEVLDVKKRLLLREEIRVSKRRTTTSTAQTVNLRREVVDIEHEDLNSADPED
jgi:uncharacterized protein (TIGR02271 family)